MCDDLSGDEIAQALVNRIRPEMYIGSKKEACVKYPILTRHYHVEDKRSPCYSLLNFLLRVSFVGCTSLTKLRKYVCYINKDNASGAWLKQTKLQVLQDREREMEVAEQKEIVIVGGGICGLATALALHRLYISF